MVWTVTFRRHFKAAISGMRRLIVRPRHRVKVRLITRLRRDRGNTCGGETRCVAKGVLAATGGVG